MKKIPESVKGIAKATLSVTQKTAQAIAQNPEVRKFAGKIRDEAISYAISAATAYIQNKHKGKK